MVRPVRHQQGHPELGITLSTTEPGAEVLKDFGTYFRESVADNLHGATEPDGPYSDAVPAAST